jgi:TatD DNase family protein
MNEAIIDMGKTGRLVDAHTHLEQYSTADLESVLKRAGSAGIAWIVTSGMDLDTSARAVELSRSKSGIVASVGIHPWVAADGLSNALYEKLASLSQQDTIVAVGEIGLDFVDNVFKKVVYRNNRELCSVQMEAFRKQVELACRMKLPMIVHSRGAYPTLITILREQKAHRVGGVIHNFNGSIREAHELLDMGFYLSIGGAITYPAAHELLEVFLRLPLEGILTETDSPYMPLYKQEKVENEPANVVHVLRSLAELRRIDIEKLVEIVYSNFENVFRLPV